MQQPAWHLQMVDVGCGIGGSSRHIAKKFGCKAQGITLSPVQVLTADHSPYFACYIVESSTCYLAYMLHISLFRTSQQPVLDCDNNKGCSCNRHSSICAGTFLDCMHDWWCEAVFTILWVELMPDGPALYSLITTFAAPCLQAERANIISQSQGMGSKVNYQVADALHQPFTDGQFDLIWSMESGEHMPDKAQFISELTRVCKPGGKILIVTWCHRCVTWTIQLHTGLLLTWRVRQQSMQATQ